MGRRALVFVACTLLVTSLLIGLDPFARGTDSTAGSQTCDVPPCETVAVPVGAVGLLALTGAVACGTGLVVIVGRGRRGWGPRRRRDERSREEP
jgi:hypothetical protein